MAKAATKAASKTTLAIQQVEVPVGLYAATGKPGEVTKFDTAGPNGGKLKYEMRAAAAPVEEDAPKGDPLGEDPGPERKLEDTVAQAETIAATGRKLMESTAAVDGEFRQALVEEGSGVEVLPDDVRHGVRMDDGWFVDCTEQLAQIEEDTKLDEMRVVAFIDAGQVPRERVLASYYVGTDEPTALPALRMLYEALRARRRAAVVRWSARSRQSLGVIVPYRPDAAAPRTLMALKLAWAEDFRDAPARAQLDSAACSEGMMQTAEQLVAAMQDTRAGALDSLRDAAVELREELRRKAIDGEELPTIEPRERAPEADPMEQWGASLAALGS